MSELIKELKIDDIIYRDDLYPRLNTSPQKVQEYAECIEVLPPVEINQNNILIDGWHRWTAHKKCELKSIKAFVTETQSEASLLELAIERNATFGLQLSMEDKRDMARKIYHITPEREREEKKKKLSKILSVSERTIREWLSRIDKDSKDARNKRIFALWMACYTQEEIAEREDTSQSEVDRLTKTFTLNGETSFLGKPDLAAAEHATDFDPPIYNVWKQQNKTQGVKHAGNTEIQWVDNLLYLYTSPFDIVVDPFAGSGSTIDICKKRFRRYWVSDRKPIVERESEIRKHDVTDGLPALARWKDVKLVYLDPPYWKQVEKQYSNDPEDLANMSLADFNKSLLGLICDFGKKLPQKSHIALIIQPTQWKADNKQFTDHVADMLKAVKLPVDMRFSVPYESQQCTPQMVEWAKENKKCLVLTREIIVWEVV